MRLRILSLTGFLLIATSALIMPVQYLQKKVRQSNENGRLLIFSGSEDSLAVLNCLAASSRFKCTANDATTTSSNRGLLASFVGPLNTAQTIYNTSNTNMNSGDQTSNVE